MTGNWMWEEVRVTLGGFGRVTFIHFCSYRNQRKQARHCSSPGKKVLEQETANIPGYTEQKGPQRKCDLHGPSQTLVRLKNPNTLGEIRFPVKNGKMTNLCPDQKCLGLLSTQRQRAMRKFD